MELYYLMLLTVACDIILSEQVGKKNIVFVLTDDQDTELGGLEPLSKTKELIGDNGAFFKNSFVTTPLCCPSRSSILTGRYASSIFVRNNSLSGNCSSSAWQKFTEPSTFVKILEEHGYNTFFAGKYLNKYGTEHAGGITHIPPGWKEWNGLVGNSVYYNYSLSINGIPEYHADKEHDYLTDVITEKSLNFLKRHTRLNKSVPFFMMLSPPACHSPFTPANRYKSRFSGIKAPRTPNFGKHSPDKHWLLRNAKSPMGNLSLNVIDDSFVNRWRTLLSVDDMVEKIILFMEGAGLLSNTYVIFSSDNGFHLGQFSLPIDKRQPYEFDIRVPLMVRGPKIRPQIVREPVLNIDLASTFLEMAGIYNASIATDGRSWLPLVLQNGSDKVKPARSAFAIEYEGEAQEVIDSCPHLNHQNVAQCHPECICEDSRNNTYRCLRVINDSLNVLHCNFLDEEEFVEVYDLTNDPYQLTNLACVAKDYFKKKHWTTSYMNFS